MWQPNISSAQASHSWDKGATSRNLTWNLQKKALWFMWNVTETVLEKSFRHITKRKRNFTPVTEASTLGSVGF
jgi:hypothetical protein